MSSLKPEYCREELGAPTWDRCNRQASFILWGKLFPAEALGPRCYAHTSDHLRGNMTMIDQYAVYDLRPINKMLEG